MSQIADTPLLADANLRAYWKLEDVNATVGGYVLTNNNSVAFNNGKYGLGADFGAANTNKYLKTSGLTAASFGLLTALTVSFWVKMLTEVSGEQYHLFYLGVEGSNHIAYEVLYQDNGGTPRLRINRRQENVTDYFANHNVTLGTTSWHNVVFTYDGTNGKLYLNNAFTVQVSMDPGNGTAGNETNGMILGRSRDFDATRYSKCIIDDVAIFDKVLSSTEMSSLFFPVASSRSLRLYRRTRIPGPVGGIV